jgi:acetoin utilization protein AcuB
MLVRDIMKCPPLTIPLGLSLQEAFRLMQVHHFRHLLVVGPEGDLQGVVTDRDLRLATSALRENPFPAGSAVSQVMSPDPLTADALDPVEDAAKVMRERKIGCLPVVEGRTPIGIITGLDLLDALIKMTGVDKPSGRLEVLLLDRPGELARLTAVISAMGHNIHSILTYPEGGAAVRTVLRIGSMGTRALAQELRGAEFEVIWPLDKPCL